MKHLVVIALAFVSFATWAQMEITGKETGGGDPHVIEFLGIGNQISQWLYTTESLKSVDRDAFRTQIDFLQRSLDVPYAEPAIEFLSDKVLCMGTEKVACTASGHVTVNRNVWMKSSYQEKVELVSSEILVLMEKMDNRYKLAQQIGDRAETIATFPRTPGSIDKRESFYIVSVSGVSTMYTSPAGITSIYAGMSGPGCFSDAPCNSCIGDFATCNPNQVGDNTVVKIQVSAIQACKSKLGQPAISNPQGTPVFMSKFPKNCDEPFEISTRWTTLCQAAFGLNCDSVSTGQVSGIRVGIWDGNSMKENSYLTVTVLAPTTASIDDCTAADGFCSFALKPGDHSAFLSDPMAGSDLSNVHGLVAFLSSKGFDQAFPGKADVTAYLAVTDDGALASSEIDNLNNSTTYFARVASTDAAGNIYGFLSYANITDPNFGNCKLDPSGKRDDDLSDGCKYRVVPGE